MRLFTAHALLSAQKKSLCSSTIASDHISAGKEPWVVIRRTWEFSATRCHELNKTEKGDELDHRMPRDGITKDAAFL